VEAELVLENVGGMSGFHNLKFTKGAVNVVKAPNAAGKSSIIRAIALCFSVPYKSRRLAEMARDMGLLRQAGEAMEPLVYIGAKSARILMKFDGEEWKLDLFKDGNYVHVREGEERFLITSLLTRSSPILNKLLKGDVDFKWIVEAVSLADRYEVVARVIEKERNKAYELQMEIERRINEIENLKKEKITLEETIKNYKQEENELSTKLSELLANRREVGELRKQRDHLIAKIKEQEEKIKKFSESIKELKKREEELSERYETKFAEKEHLEKENKKFLKEIEVTNKELKELDEDLKNYEERLKNIEKQVESLRVEEGRLLAKSEMYEEALKLLAQSQKVLCFLCEEGYLTAKRLGEKVSSVKRQLSEVRDKISVFLNERNKIYSKLRKRDELKKKLKELIKTQSEILRKLQSIEQALSTYLEEVKPIHERRIGLEARLKDEEQLLNKYRDELKELDKSISELGKEEQVIVERIATLRGRIEEVEKQLKRIEKMLETKSYIETIGHRMTLERAKKVLEEWLTTLDEVLRNVQVEARKERIMAMELFNDQIKKVLKDSKFDYLDVWIDASNFRLHIIDRRVGVEVSPRILSEAERYVLVLIIHIALKLAYSPYPPFLLVDEVVLSLDETRRRAVLNYLSHLAKENGWFVILTELGHEPEITVSLFTGL
jgi:chromosome segregation ATPase